MKQPLLCMGDGHDDAGCYRPCGPDLVVSDDHWRRIAPAEGMLCPNCMHDRFVSLGFADGSVPARFTSGPFARSDAADRAVAHLMRRIATDPRLAWFFDPLTESMKLLTAAYAEAKGLDVGLFRNELASTFRAERPVCSGGHCQERNPNGQGG